MHTFRIGITEVEVTEKTLVFRLPDQGDVKRNCSIVSKVMHYLVNEAFMTEMEMFDRDRKIIPLPIPRLH